MGEKKRRLSSAQATPPGQRERIAHGLRALQGGDRDGAGRAYRQLLADLPRDAASISATGALAMELGDVANA